MDPKCNRDRLGLLVLILLLASGCATTGFSTRARQVAAASQGVIEGYTEAVVSLYTQQRRDLLRRFDARELTAAEYFARIRALDAKADRLADADIKARAAQKTLLEVLALYEDGIVKRARVEQVLADLTRAIQEFGALLQSFEGGTR